MPQGRSETKNKLIDIENMNDEELEINHEYIRNTAKQSRELILGLERRITKLEKENRFLKSNKKEGN